MAPGFDDQPSQQNAGTDREPLVDINPQSASSGETGTQLKPRRKRLSDIQGQTDEPQPEPKAQRRSLSEVAQANVVEEPAPERPSPSGRPRLSITQSQTAVMEAPEDAGTVPIYDGTAACDPLDETPPAPPAADPSGTEQSIEELRGRQSRSIAVAGGLLAAAVGAMLWAVVTTATNLHIAWMAVPVGLLVSGVVRVLGRGLDKTFGYLGVALVAFACLLGSHLTNCMFIARETGLAATSVLTQVNPAAILRLMIGTLHPLDILFYGLALYEGYRLSFRRIPRGNAAPRNG